jgi:hypothetical protein
MVKAARAATMNSNKSFREGKIERPMVADSERRRRRTGFYVARE